MPPTVSVPLISVVIPAFRAGGTIGDAVRSVLAGGVPEDRLEILVESDDGTDYAGASALSPAVRVAVSGAVGSGVGPARNRALARARGEWVAFLDADDVFAPGYLAALLPQAQAEAAAAAPLVVTEGEGPILHLWSGQNRLGFDDLAATGASVRLMLARGNCPRFADAPSQDILHAVQVMARQGGSLPLSNVPYVMNLTRDSVTAAAGFADRLHAAYQDHIATLEAQGLPAAADVFRAKIALNAAYKREGRGRSYYGFISRILSA